MYYNTNEEDGPGLRESWARTAKQNDLILMIFQQCSNLIPIGGLFYTTLSYFRPVAQLIL